MASSLTSMYNSHGMHVLDCRSTLPEDLDHLTEAGDSVQCNKWAPSLFQNKAAMNPVGGLNVEGIEKLNDVPAARRITRPPFHKAPEAGLLVAALGFLCTVQAARHLDSNVFWRAILRPEKKLKPQSQISSESS